MRSSDDYPTCPGGTAPAAGSDQISPLTASIADNYADLLEPLTGQQRRVVMQRLADDYYRNLNAGDETAHLPSRAEVSNVIADLWMSTPTPEE